MIEKTSELSAQDAFRTVHAFLSDDKDLRKLDPHYRCQFDEGALTVIAKGKQFEAKLKVVDAETTRVILEVSLPWPLTPIKGLVEKSLRNKLASALVREKVT
jgi:hypothetical protein